MVYFKHKSVVFFYSVHQLWVSVTKVFVILICIDKKVDVNCGTICSTSGQLYWQCKIHNFHLVLGVWAQKWNISQGYYVKNSIEKLQRAKWPKKGGLKCWITNASGHQISMHLWCFWRKSLLAACLKKYFAEK